MDSAANSGLAEAVGLTDMGLSAVLAPVHQRDQEPVLQAMGGGASACVQMLLQSCTHGQKGVWKNAGKPLEDRRLQQNNICVKHIPRIPDSGEN